LAIQPDLHLPKFAYLRLIKPDALAACGWRGVARCIPVALPLTGAVRPDGTARRLSLSR